MTEASFALNEGSILPKRGNWISRSNRRSSAKRSLMRSYLASRSGALRPSSRHGAPSLRDIILPDARRR